MDKLIKITLELHQSQVKFLKEMAAKTGSDTGTVLGAVINVYRGSLRDGFMDQYGNRYQTVAEAGEKLGLEVNLIRMVLRGVRRSTGGYCFRWVTGDV